MFDTCGSAMDVSESDESNAGDGETADSDDSDEEAAAATEEGSEEARWISKTGRCEVDTFNETSVEPDG